eukprot:jgi/Botrbrau1/23195/Bobra.0041s0042.1
MTIGAQVRVILFGEKREGASMLGRDILPRHFRVLAQTGSTPARVPLHEFGLNPFGLFNERAPASPHLKRLATKATARVIHAVRQVPFTTDVACGISST